MLNKMWGDLEPSKLDNPFIIRRYSSKRHSTFLDYHMKLSHCHVDVTEISAHIPGANSFMLSW